MDALAMCRTDQEVFEYLGTALERQVPHSRHEDLDLFVSALQGLTPGYRAMAATYELDVSLSLDDLGWHFANWHHLPLAHETSDGLLVLEAFDAAELFNQAFALVRPHWDQIGSLVSIDFDRFIEWYDGSGLSAAIDPLNERMWKIYEQDSTYGLLRYWIGYARKYPERLEPNATDAA